MQHHKYSLTELENMLPWERNIYLGLLMKYLEEERERIAHNGMKKVLDNYTQIQVVDKLIAAYEKNRHN